MKSKDLIKLLSYKPEAEVFFEEAGNNQGGEPENFPLGFKEIYGTEKEITIVLLEN